MRTLLLSTSALALSAFLITGVAAREYTADKLPYTDAPTDRSAAIAVSTLTEMGVVEGNPDGTFRFTSRLNRAEFMKIVMGLIPDGPVEYPVNCFVDVPQSTWYSDAVCRAKKLGYVSGNNLPGLSQSQWPFQPSRNVQYEEALKVLARIYALPLPNDTGGEWYEIYLRAAAAAAVAIPALEPGDAITRGEMARLAVAFMAYSDGELDLLREAEKAQSNSRVSSRSSTQTSSTRSVSAARSSSRSSSSRSGTYDPLPVGTVQSNVLLMGQVSPVLAGFKVFSNNEPIEGTAIEIDLAAAADSIESFLIYDQNGRLLATANQKTSTKFRGTLASNAIVYPRREEVSLYVRARIKSHDSGATSGQNVEVDSVMVEGNGVWSNDDYAMTSTETFPTFEVARAVIAKIERVGSSEDVLVAGSSQLLGEFRFEGKLADAGADLRVTDLTFQIESGGVSLSNVQLRVDGSDTSHSCSVSSSTATCSTIPASHGSIKDGPKTIRVYGDVSGITGGSPFLRLALNDPGTPTSAGAITWTDGAASVTWVPFSQPIVRGTLFD